MKTQMRLSVYIGLALVLTWGGGMSSSFAQGSKYKRNTNKKADAAAEAAASGAAGASTPSGAAPSPSPGAGSAAASPGAPAPTPSSEKVDISDLEQRYWAPKDTEFSVVQNRLYSKAKRFGFTLGWGPLINDTYADGSMMGASLNYYFSERHGAEVSYSKASVQKNQLVAGLNTYGAEPDHNLIQSYTGVAYNWIPIYAKLSLLEQKIIYFDMSFSPGVGFVNYQQQLIGGAGDSKQAVALSLDVAQHYFLNQHLALRVDLKNRMYNQEIVKWRYNTSPRTESTTSTTVLFGLTYYH